MKLKSALIALGALSRSGLTVGAEEALENCNVEIEGATVLMSRDEIAAEWSSRGYVEPPQSRRRSFSAPPDPSKSLSYQTADGLPNDRFMSSMGWADKTHSEHYDGQSHYNVVTTYQPPAGEAELETYKQFLRGEITSWCEWAAPILEGQEDRYRRRKTELICGKVLIGDFYTTPNGIPIHPVYAAVGQTWNGCNWAIASDNNGHLSVTVSGPLNLAK